MESLNLVPDACLERQLRARRIRLWLAVAVLGGAGVLLAAFRLAQTRQAVDELNASLTKILATKSDLDRRLIEQQRVIDELTARAGALVALRRAHPLPEQLLTLTNAAPDSVVFTRIAGEPPERKPAPRPPQTQASSQPPPPFAEALVVRMQGYALDHPELETLVERLQQIPNWEQVNQVRVARETFHAGEAVAFQLECRPRKAVE